MNLSVKYLALFDRKCHTQGYRFRNGQYAVLTKRAAYQNKQLDLYPDVLHRVCPTGLKGILLVRPQGWREDIYMSTKCFRPALPEEIEKGGRLEVIT